MIYTKHTSVGEINTPEAPLDYPLVDIDSEAIARLASASKAEVNIRNHHLQRYDHAHAAQKQLAQGNCERIKSGVVDTHKKAESYNKKIEKTDEFIEEAEQHKQLSMIQKFVVACLNISGTLIALSGVWIGVGYWFDRPEKVSLTEASWQEISVAGAALMVVLLGSMSVKFLISRIHSDRNKRIVIIGLGTLPSMALLVWVYCFVQLIVAPGLISPAEVIASMGDLDATVESNTNSLSLVMIYTQIVIELCASAICFHLAGEVLSKGSVVNVRRNRKYDLLVERFDWTQMELGKLRHDLALNEAYVSYVEEGRKHFVFQAFAEYSLFRAKAEAVEKVNQEKRLALDELKKERELEDQAMQRQRVRQLEAQEALNTTAEQQERDHQNRVAELKTAEQKAEAYAEQLIKENLRSGFSSVAGEAKGKVTPILPSDRQTGFACLAIMQTLAVTALMMLCISTMWITSAEAKTHVFVISSTLSKSDAGKTMQSATKLVAMEMALTDKLVVYDGTAGEIVSTIDLSSVKTDSVKSRLYSGAAGMAKLRNFLKNASAVSSNTGRLFLPQIMREFALSFPYSKDDLQMLVVGSPIYHDDTNERTASFTMEGGYVPNDAHFKSTVRKSPYAVESEMLGQVDLHFVSTFKGWVDKTLHQDRVHRFWDLWVSQNGGTLATFTDDFDTGFQRYLSGARRQANYEVDETQSKVMMERITPSSVMREVESWLGDGAVVSTAPSELSRGKVKIGITWDCTRCDLDLHARGSRDYKPLYFGRSRTSEGKFNKDFTSQPLIKNGYEYIEFTRAITFDESEVRVNFYSGHARNGVNGRVRIWINGDVYSKDFYFPAKNGNHGSQSLDHWVDIKLTEVISVPESV